MYSETWNSNDKNFTNMKFLDLCVDGMRIELRNILIYYETN